MFSCPRYIIHLNSCSKDSKLTIFRGFTVLHFRGISSISRDKRVILIYSRSATICHKVHHRTALMVFLCALKKPSLLVLEKFNVDHFSRSHGSSFARNFVYFWDKRVLQTYLRTATMCPWVYHSETLMVFLPPIYN